MRILYVKESLRQCKKSLRILAKARSYKKIHFLYPIIVFSHALLKSLSPRNPCKKSSFPITMVLTFPRPFNNGIVESCFLYHLGSLCLHIVLGLSVWLWVPRVPPCLVTQQLSCGCLRVNGMWIHLLVNAVFGYFQGTNNTASIEIVMPESSRILSRTHSKIGNTVSYGVCKV